MDKLNVVVVPLYKENLNTFERIALKQCFKVFRNQVIYAIKPHGLDLTELQKDFLFHHVVSFDNDFFTDINGYNKLMMSALFYKEFLSFNYMLIYQTDAFVFSDQLDYWVSCNYDYIGAPWLRPLKNNWAVSSFFISLKSYLYTRFNIKKNGLPKGKQFYNKVGNGGFSLRNIKKFYELSIIEQQLAQHYIDLKNPAFNEDLFWSVEINRMQKRLNIPNFKIAVQFAIETYPEFAFKLTQNTLPFGCHAWEKHLVFWKPFIKAEGHGLT